MGLGNGKNGWNFGVDELLRGRHCQEAEAWDSMWRPQGMVAVGTAERKMKGRKWLGDFGVGFSLCTHLGQSHNISSRAHNFL